MVSELTGHTRPELPSLSLGQKAFPLLKETLLLATKKQSPAHSSSLGKPVIPSKMNAQGRGFRVRLAASSIAALMSKLKNIIASSTSIRLKH